MRSLFWKEPLRFLLHRKEPLRFLLRWKERLRFLLHWKEPLRFPLYWKGMLAFLVVIVVAVGTVALLAGRVTENAFRRYALGRDEMWERQAERLAAYFIAHGSWVGIQDALSSRVGMMEGAGPRGYGRDEEPVRPPLMDFRLADFRAQVVADTSGPPGGTLSQSELENSISIQVDGQVVAHLLPSARNLTALPLDRPQLAFLTRIRTTLWIAALAAVVAALGVGGLLFRSIVAPLHRLTEASQAIAEGDLSARASVRGQDEVAQLADSFNQMAESLARAEEARQNQTADIAHELRTPLTVIQGTLEAMLDGVYTADRENVLAGLAQTRTLSRLVDDLRLLALADAGKIQLEKSPLDLYDFLNETLEAHQPQAQEQGICLVLEAPPALPTVPADRDRLAQVMGNLLGNALRYVPEGGHVTVRVDDQGQEVVVQLVDDGPGVAPKDLPHLFERFWRGDPSRRRATGGSGLGLAIARHVVEAHGGQIWAEPTPGGGLTIAFSLPAARETKT